MYETASTTVPASPEGASKPSLSDRVQSLRLPDRVAARKSPFANIPWVLCAVLAGTTAYFALNQAPAGKQNPVAVNPSQQPMTPTMPNKATPGTPVAPPKSDSDIALEGKGYIIPISLILVSPKVGGTVTELYIQEGKRVKKGELLAEIEDTEFRADRDRVKAQVEGAKHRLDELWKYREKEISQAKAEMDDSIAQREQLFLEYKRAQSLKTISALAPKEYEQAESAYKSMDFRVERLKLAYDLLRQGPRDERIAAAKKEVAQWEAELTKAQWKFDNCQVVAPISGIILSKKAEKGNQVNPSAFSNGLSASLCEMADLTKLEVDLSIAERDISKIFAGQKCKIRAEAYMDRYYEGVVSRVMPTADRAKGAVPVRVLIDVPVAEEGQFLRPEMGAIVTFMNDKAKK